MSKIKKSLIFILGVITLSAPIQNAAVNAESQSPAADWSYVMSIVKPDGYEECRGDYEYARYNQESNGYSFLSYYDFRYNHVWLSIDSSVDWDSVYEKYCAELGFDKAVDDGMIELYDVPDEGDDPLNPATVEDKSDEVAAMCAEMYRDGILESAYYSAVRAFYTGYSIMNILYCDFDGTEQELAVIIDGYSTDYEIKAPENEGDMYTVEFFDIQSLAKLDEVSRLLRTDENVDNVTRSSDIQQSVTFKSAEHIDLFAVLESQSESSIKIGDLTLDGKIGITDIIALSKANADIIALNEAQLTAADCNGDGSVNGSDLTALLSFITEKVDSLPVGAG